MAYGGFVSCCKGDKSSILLRGSRSDADGGLACVSDSRRRYHGTVRPASHLPGPLLDTVCVCELSVVLLMTTTCCET